MPSSPNLTSGGYGGIITEAKLQACKKELEDQRAKTAEIQAQVEARAASIDREGEGLERKINEVSIWSR